jgi:hypothetical protein
MFFCLPGGASNTAGFSFRFNYTFQPEHEGYLTDAAKLDTEA